MSTTCGEHILAALDGENRCGLVLRAKGMAAASDGGWLRFDFVPGETEAPRGSRAREPRGR